MSMADISSMDGPGRYHPGQCVLVLNRGALGDVLMTLPFLAALPGHFGVKALSPVGNPASLSLFEPLSFINKIHDHNRAVWSGLYRDPPFMNENWTEYLRAHAGAVVLARKIDDPTVTGLKKLGIVPVLTAPSRPPAEEVHLVDHIFQTTGVRPLAEPVWLVPAEGNLVRAREYAQKSHLPQGRWLAMHPGSGDPGKNWSLEKWLELASRMERQSGLRPAFLIGPAEEKVKAQLNNPAGASSPMLVENLPLPVLAGLLTLSAGYIGHDSGVTHMAAALGLPTIALFGPTNPRHWAPRGPRVEVIAPPGAPTSDWSWLDPDRILTVINSSIPPVSGPCPC